MAANQAPTFRIVNWLSEVMKAWGDQWHEPEVAYKFSNEREFKDSGDNGGIYDQD